MAGIWRLIHFNLLQHRGRIGRLRYIASTVVLAAALLMTVLIGGALSRHIGNATGLVVGTALYLMTVFLSANLAVKRLHDLGFPGWHYLWVFALGYFAEGWLGSDRLQPLGLASYSLALAFGLLLSAWPGTKDTNRYGPPPR